MSVTSLVHLSNETAELVIDVLEIFRRENCTNLEDQQALEFSQLIQGLTNFDSIRLEIESPDVPNKAA